MSIQLRNTIRLQHITRELSSFKSKKHPDSDKIAKLRKEIEQLKESRGSAPPILKVRGHRVTLLIPFLSPSNEMLKQTLHKIPRTRRAGVDRGLRHPIVLSVRNGG